MCIRDSIYTGTEPILSISSRNIIPEHIYTAVSCITGLANYSQPLLSENEIETSRENSRYSDAQLTFVKHNNTKNTCKYIYTQRDRQTDRETDGQRDRQTDRQRTYGGITGD